MAVISAIVTNVITLPLLYTQCTSDFISRPFAVPFTVLLMNATRYTEEELEGLGFVLNRDPVIKSSGMELLSRSCNIREL